MNTIVDDLKDIKAEQRGLKTNQPIMGASLKTAWSRFRTDDYIIPKGGGLGSSVEGVMTVKLKPAEGNDKMPDYPVIDWLVEAWFTIDDSFKIPLSYENSYPKNGGTQFYWRPENMTKDGVATIRALLTLNEYAASNGGTLYIWISGLGAASFDSVSVNWTYHKA